MGSPRLSQATGTRGEPDARGPFAPRGAVVALAVTVAILGIAVALGGAPLVFINIPSLLLVFGGTLAAVTLATSWPEVCAAWHAAIASLADVGPDLRSTALSLLQLAEIARLRGMLALQPEIDRMETTSFLRQAMLLAIDGVSEEDIDSVLRIETQARTERGRQSAAVLRRAADCAPAMGLIGTLIGLVQMLGQLDDPSAIGPSMAIALLTTFYGAVLANIVLTPLAVRVERRVADEATGRAIIRLGALSIAQRENPRRLETVINSVLPPDQPINYFDRPRDLGRDEPCAC